MLEEIKELCIFMVCGQTLLYFQSGKKYEKICKMILELLVLAGIVGMILNFLQSIGIQKGEMEASGGAVAGMQRSMEEALSKQLDGSVIKGELGISMDSLVEKYTMQEIKSKYNYFAKQYGLEIEKVEQNGEMLRVFVKESALGAAVGDGGWGSNENAEQRDNGAGQETQENAADVEDFMEIAEMERIEIGKIEIGKGETENEREKGEGRGEETEVENEKGAESGEEIEAENENGAEKGEGYKNEKGIDEVELENFRRQFALMLVMEEEKLEVILID